MPKYTDRQSWIGSAFRGIRTLCVLDCDCGMVHFVSSEGRGDYEDGELERLQQSAKEQPAKYYEHSDFDHVDAVFIDGHQYVVDCPCGKIDRYCKWIEDHADGLAAYLTLYFRDRFKRLQSSQQECKQAMELLESAVGGEVQS